MPGLASCALLAWLTLVWFAAIVATASGEAVVAKAGGFEPGGVSVFPGIPVFPLSFWALAVVADFAWAPWGSVVVASVHLWGAVVCGRSVLRDARWLRELEDEVSEWVALPDSHVRYRVEASDGVMWTELDGFVDSDAELVSRLRDVLDDAATRLGDDVEVGVLDVRGFANASGDESQILLTVFQGIPTVWLVDDAEHQDDAGRDWSIPARGWLAETADAARRRALGWRAAGSVAVNQPRGESVEVARWTDRGLLRFHYRNDRLATTDLYHHNRLVERVYDDTRVVWPHPDRRGRVPTRVARLDARVVWRAHEIEVVDLSESSAGPSDWLAALDELETVRELWLPPEPIAEGLLVTVLARLPRLRELVLGKQTSWGPEVQQSLRSGWAPALTWIRTRGRLSDAARDELESLRPGLRITT